MLVPENQSPTVAVLLPCYNEEVTIGKVVRDFKASLPQADIYVYDNNSTDRTADIAASEGAIVRKEPRQGKGNVIRAMFEDIDADVYVMADGDDTYPADAAPAMVDKVLEGYDMVIGDRLSSTSTSKRTNEVSHSDCQACRLATAGRPSGRPSDRQTAQQRHYLQ